MSLGGVHVGEFAPNLPVGGRRLEGPRPWILLGPEDGDFLGVATVETIQKTAAERRTVTIPFDKPLRGSTLASVTAAVQSGDLELLESVAYSQTVVKVMLQAGTAGTTSVVRVSALGADGQLIEFDFAVEVVV